MKVYARALGATVGRHVDLHSAPPVTGLLSLGAGCSVEAEVDLAGYWLDGDLLQVGSIAIGENARIGTRSTLCPGAVIGASAEVGAGSAVFGDVPAGEYWSGGPAAHVTEARGPWSDAVPRNRPRWVLAYAASALLISLLPLLAVPGRPAGGVATGCATRTSVADAFRTAAITLPARDGRRTARAAHCSWWPAYDSWRSGSSPATTRCTVASPGRRGPRCGSSTSPGAGSIPLYASTLTPLWLRVLGAEIGEEVEASTVLLIPKLTTVNDGAFLADDTLLGGYELGGGWLRIDEVKIGKHAFLGNSGMAAPGRKVPKRSLVAVLSAAPRRTKAKAGHVVDRQPAHEAPSRRRRRRPDPHLPARHAGSRWPRRSSRCAAWSRSCSTSLLVLAAVTALLELWLHAGWWAAAVLSGLVLIVGGTVAAGDRDGRQVGAGGADPGRPSIRCGAASCGATSWPTPSSR